VACRRVSYQTAKTDAWKSQKISSGRKLKRKMITRVFHVIFGSDIFLPNVGKRQHALAQSSDLRSRQSSIWELI
jgi:hypothetical protein